MGGAHGKRKIASDAPTEVVVAEGAEAEAQPRFAKERQPVEQWVSAVTNFSSEYGKHAYCHAKLIGEPKVFPNYGDCLDAMVVRTYGPWWQMVPSSAPRIEDSKFRCRDFIELEFDRPVVPTQIEIFETYNPGSLVRILALPSAGKDSLVRWQVIWKGQVQDVPPESRCFKPDLRPVQFHTNLIRLELDSEMLDYYAEFDAVKLIGFQMESDLPRAVSAADEITLRSNAQLYSQLAGSRGGSRNGSRRNSRDLDGGDGDGPLEAGSFDMLPDELLLDILDEFHTMDLLRLGGVCRRFYWGVTTVMRSRHQIDLQPIYDAVTDSALSYLAPKMHATRHLNLSWIGSTAPFDLVTGSGLEEVAKVVGVQLTTLRLACCAIVTDDVLAEICSRCPNLTELDIQRCEGLTHNAFFHIKQLRRLERLNLYSTFVTEAGLESVCKSCGPTLKHLDLGHCNHLRPTANHDPITAIAEHCSSLNLTAANRYTTSETVMAIAQKCPLLEELDVGWCSKLHIPMIIRHVARKPLKKLFLTATRTVDDDCLRILASECPMLEQLDVLGSHGVTGMGISALLAGCPRLVLLDVSFCGSLQKSDLQMWSDEHPHVTIKQSFTT